jgi:hypothetical protein
MYAPYSKTQSTRPLGYTHTQWQVHTHTWPGGARFLHVSTAPNTCGREGGGGEA